MNLRPVLNVDIKFNCAVCGTPMVIDEAGAGMAVQCPSCGQSLTVPPARPAVVIDASSAVHQAAAAIESGIFDDDRKLDEYLRKENPGALADVFGKKRARAFLAGKINGRELLGSVDFKLSPEKFAQYKSEFNAIHQKWTQ